MFDVCTTGDTAHIDTIFKFLPYTRQHVTSDLDDFTGYTSSGLMTHQWILLKFLVLLMMGAEGVRNM